MSAVRRCASCGKPAQKDGNKFWPMCSERCHLVDLGRWLGEEYRVPGEPDPTLGALGPAGEEEKE